MYITTYLFSVFVKVQLVPYIPFWSGNYDCKSSLIGHNFLGGVAWGNSKLNSIVKFSNSSNFDMVKHIRMVIHDYYIDVNERQWHSSDLQTLSSGNSGLRIAKSCI